MPAVIGDIGLPCDGTDPADVERQSTASHEERLPIGAPRSFNRSLTEDRSARLRLDASSDREVANGQIEVVPLGNSEVGLA